MFTNPVAGTPLLPSDYLVSFTAVFLGLLAAVYLAKRKVKPVILAALAIVAVAAILLGLLLLPSPEISKSNLKGDEINLTDPIYLQFDRPVSRRSMEKSITPDVPGTWVFEDPVYLTHLYRKVVFYPQDGFQANTTYTVKIVGIENTIRKSKPYEVQFSFKTQNAQALTASNSVAAVAPKPQTFKLPVPAYLQQHTLSCEVSSLRMALAYKGISKTEEDLMAQVGVDNTPHIDGTWGDPYEHFVGNVDGNQMRDGYGVYWGPIERVARNYGKAEAFQGGNIEKLTKAISAGNPVIIWVYSSSGRPTHWKTSGGKDIFAVAGEHTVVAVGFVGSASNPTQIIVNDSLVGQVYWSRSQFDHKWATFNQAGVIIYK